MSASDVHELFPAKQMPPRDGERAVTSFLDRPRREPKPLTPTPELLALEDLKDKGLRSWDHHHFERKYPLNYRFACIAPKLGRAILTVVYSMSGPQDIIATGKTAESYRSYLAQFFAWLKDERELIERGLGQNDCFLPPSVFIDYKKYLDRRVNKNTLQSKSAYQYKGALTRVLHRLYLSDKTLLGPEWTERHFQHEDFSNDTKQREPYSAAEARRILDYCIAALSQAVKDKRIDDPSDYLVEIAAYTAISLQIGIESECLDALSVGDVKRSADGKVMAVTYQKRRLRKSGKRTRTADPHEPVSDSSTLTEKIGSFRSAGGQLALMLRRANRLNKDPSDPLWLRRLSASEFRRLTDILFASGLRCDRGGRLKIDRTKFRVTHKTAKTIRAKGKLQLFPEDNTPDVNARHYLESDRMMPFYEEAIENAGLEAIRYALVGCKVVDLPDNASAETVASAAAALHVPAEQIQAALDGDTDLWLSSCTSFFSSPFDPPGKPCSKSFFRCLGCGNALVTRRTLPRVIRFLSHIVQKRSEMPDLDWQAKFGESHRQITREIIPRFPEAVIAEARVIAQGIGVAILIPPEMLV